MKDVINALSILESFGASPTYDTPNGIKGDGLRSNGTSVACSAFTAPIGRSDKISAVSAVVEANGDDIYIMPYLKDRAAFEEYLSMLDISGDPYAVGSTLESKVYQIFARDEMLAEEGKKSGILRLPIFGWSVHNRPNFNGYTPSGRNIFPNSRKSLYL